MNARDDIAARRIRHTASQRLCFSGAFDHVQLVSQPLNRGSGDEDAPLQGILGRAVRAGGQCCQQAILEATAWAPVCMSKKQPVP